MVALQPLHAASRRGLEHFCKRVDFASASILLFLPSAAHHLKQLCATHFDVFLSFLLFFLRAGIRWNSASANHRARKTAKAGTRPTARACFLRLGKWSTRARRRPTAPHKRWKPRKWPRPSTGPGSRPKPAAKSSPSPPTSLSTSSQRCVRGLRERT